MLARVDRALVVPVLVAYDEGFQDRIIGGAVAEVGDRERVAYVPDAILPEPALDDWIVAITRESLEATAAASPGQQP